jgi:hypothetical protein
MSIFSSPNKIVERAEHPTSAELMEMVKKDIETVATAIGQIMAPIMEDLSIAIRTFVIAHYRQCLLSILSQWLPPHSRQAHRLRHP